MSVGHRFKGTFQDKNRENPHLFRFHYSDIHSTNPQISCVCFATGLQLLEQIIWNLKPWNFNYVLSAGHQTFSFTSIREPQVKETYTQRTHRSPTEIPGKNSKTVKLGHSLPCGRHLQQPPRASVPSTRSLVPWQWQHSRSAGTCFKYPFLRPLCNTTTLLLLLRGCENTC